MFTFWTTVFALSCFAAATLAGSSEERDLAQFFGQPSGGNSYRSSGKSYSSGNRPSYQAYEAPQGVRYVQPEPSRYQAPEPVRYYEPEPVRYSRPSSNRYSKGHSDEYHQAAKYQFGYQVKANGGKGYGSGSREGNSAEFGHTENRDGDNTNGKYYVQLPDGRLQTVEYYVNGDSGYVAKVSYSGGNSNFGSGEKTYA